MLDLEPGSRSKQLCCERNSLVALSLNDFRRMVNLLASRSKPCSWILEPLELKFTIGIQENSPGSHVHSHKGMAASWAMVQCVSRLLDLTSWTHHGLVMRRPGQASNCCENFWVREPLQTICCEETWSDGVSVHHCATDPRCIKLRSPEA